MILLIIPISEDKSAYQKSSYTLDYPRAAHGVQSAHGNAACRSQHSSPPDCLSLRPTNFDVAPAQPIALTRHTHSH